MCAYLRAPGWREDGRVQMMRQIPLYFDSLAHQHMGPFVTSFKPALFDGDPRRVSDRITAYGLFIDPPLGRIGMTEREARESGRKALVGKMMMARVGRARERSETQGFMKILVDAETEKILGAAVLGIGGDWLKDGDDDKVLLSGSALSGSGTELKGRHIIDPRTGRPAEGHLGAWACCPSASVADALSTAFLVMSTEEVEDYCSRHPDTFALVVAQEDGKPVVHRFGKDSIA